MKKILILILIGFSIISCEKEPEKPVKDYLVLSGEIKNFRKKEINLNGFNFSEKVKFDKKTGTFSDTLKIDKDGYYTLVVQKRRVNIKLYLNDTVDTKIIFDYKKPDAITFKGGNANINNYLMSKKDAWDKYFVSANHFFSLEEEAFLENANKYKEALLDLLKSSNLPAEFSKKEAKNIEYEHLRSLSNYEYSYAALTGNPDFIVSENFPNHLENFDYGNRNDYINSYDYRKILKVELEHKAKEKHKEAGGDYFITYLETVETEVNDSLAKNDLLYKKAKADITFTSNLKEFYDKFMEFSTDEEHKKLISESYNLLKTTAKGQPAPKFTDFENYNGGTTSLDDLLNKGNYLYIDVWATWCGYCKREIPLLKKLEEEYHGKKITFVSISTDVKSAHEKWKQTIVDREMTGVQLFSGQTIANLEWAKKFLIKGLPKFIIIDPDGNIISPNAPPPTSGQKLIDIFDELGI